MIREILSLCLITQKIFLWTHCSEINDDLLYEDNEVFVFDYTVTSDEELEGKNENLANYESTLEEPTADKSGLENYEEMVVRANIEHNAYFDEYNKKRNGKAKRQLPSYDEFTWRYKTEEQPDTHYDYEQFKREYDEQAEKTKKEQGAINETEFTSPLKTQCDADKFYNIGPITTTCLLKEYYSDNAELRENASEKLSTIVRFWVIVLLLFIVVGWAHFGCLNILCPCSFCFPEDGYEEIKRFLVLNPPGVRVRQIIPKTQTEKPTIIEKDTYPATETEHYLYNKLWKTIYNV